MSKTPGFVYDEKHRWWTHGPSVAMPLGADERGVLRYVGDERDPQPKGAAPDPVWRSVKAKRKRNKETGLPL